MTTHAKGPPPERGPFAVRVARDQPVNLGSAATGVGAGVGVGAGGRGRSRGADAGVEGGQRFSRTHDVGVLGTPGSLTPLAPSTICSTAEGGSFERS